MKDKYKRFLVAIATLLMMILTAKWFYGQNMMYHHWIIIILIEIGCQYSVQKPEKE